MELGVRKALIVIDGQYVVAVTRDVQIGKGLARRRTDYARKLVVVECVIAFERQLGDARLQTFLDAERNEEVAGVALIIVCQIAAHPHIAEAVRLIKFGQRSHITGELP